MAEVARVITTDAEIDAALEMARRYESTDRRVATARYTARTDAFVLRLEHGVTYSLPRRLLQGLAEADARSLSQIEILGNGTGLYWPAFDVAHSVSGLLAGVFGSAKWMSHLDLESIARRIPA